MHFLRAKLESEFNIGSWILCVKVNDKKKKPSQCMFIKPVIVTNIYMVLSKRSEFFKLSFLWTSAGIHFLFFFTETFKFVSLFALLHCCLCMFVCISMWLLFWYHLSLHVHNSWRKYRCILYLICIICSYFNVTSLKRYEAKSKLFIDQGRTTLYQLLRYICQYRCNVVFT